MDCLELWILVIIGTKLHNVRQFIIPDNPILNLQFLIANRLIILKSLLVSSPPCIKLHCIALHLKISIYRILMKDSQALI
jgi:hypothetical protein